MDRMLTGGQRLPPLSHLRWSGERAVGAPPQVLPGAIPSRTASPMLADPPAERRCALLGWQPRPGFIHGTPHYASKGAWLASIEISQGMSILLASREAGLQQ